MSEQPLTIHLRRAFHGTYILNFRMNTLARPTDGEYPLYPRPARTCVYTPSGNARALQPGGRLTILPHPPRPLPDNQHVTKTELWLSSIQRDTRQATGQIGAQGAPKAQRSSATG